MSKLIPTELYELTAREEKWIPVDELTVGFMRDVDADIADSIIKYAEPEFYNEELDEFANAESWQALVEQQNIHVYEHTFRIPAGLPPEIQHLAREFRAFITYYRGDSEFVDYGSCCAFRTTAHQEDFERIEAPAGAVMAIIFDGGPVARFMNLSYEDYKAFDAITQFFKLRGYWFENGTHWWAWVMKND